MALPLRFSGSRVTKAIHHMPTQDQLMNASGAADNAVSAFERTHGCRPAGPLMDEYNRLLLASADAKAALRCHIAKVTGVWQHSLFDKSNT